MEVTRTAHSVRSQILINGNNIIILNAGTLAVLVFLACPASSSSRHKNVPIFTTTPVYVWPACLIACTSDSEFGLFAEAST